MFGSPSTVSGGPSMVRVTSAQRLVLQSGHGRKTGTGSVHADPTVVAIWTKVQECANVPQRTMAKRPSETPRTHPSLDGEKRWGLTLKPCGAQSTGLEAFRTMTHGFARRHSVTQRGSHIGATWHVSCLRGPITVREQRRVAQRIEAGETGILSSARTVDLAYGSRDGVPSWPPRGSRESWFGE